MRRSPRELPMEMGLARLQSTASVLFISFGDIRADL